MLASDKIAETVLVVDELIVCFALDAEEQKAKEDDVCRGAGRATCFNESGCPNDEADMSDEDTELVEIVEEYAHACEYCEAVECKFMFEPSDKEGEAEQECD
ncbi:uncharacterized protein MONOS_15858 [Monocercomonoides exilis]|uniref:uncharacterized protein n=1 Tax=Monocercomonoides exilis TaxID=2049356 RepID=UPI0035596129|nr:hypothetical protein MONOS_15858 [Monocercomonoides exilis]|eukprot:MONOS_15858.1-p1 / transcript=MONOS_15858.1 / gene=MONOS_15858 / organism=Monocercomonoides_exilis_PA203 / gene_product=unspecified product / transcript_product=unspecified product / location=Mono_scaffold01381:7718-8023(-) / protein_length=102 / sequence_SO=supercontig / SO=protein_coding / is_pseudo=false